MVIVYVAAGVPVVGVVPPPLLPPQAASRVKQPTRAPGRRTRMVRELYKSNKTANAITHANLPRGKFMGAKAELRAVVVIVSVFPLIEQLPAGMVQLAVRVGCEENPASLI
jgi:hypothetical protein